MSTDDQYLTVAEAASRLRLNQKTIRSYIEDGLLKAYRLGPRRIQILEEDLLALLTPIEPSEQT